MVNELKRFFASFRNLIKRNLRVTVAGRPSAAAGRRVGRGDDRLLLLLLLLRGGRRGGRRVDGSVQRRRFRFRLLGRRRRLSVAAVRTRRNGRRHRCRRRRRRRFAFAASYRTVNGPSPRQERSAQQRRSARVTAETLFGRVPVLSFVAHLSCGHAKKKNVIINGFQCTADARFRENRVKFRPCLMCKKEKIFDFGKGKRGRVGFSFSYLLILQRRVCFVF